ncbi:MAG TPA: hypothetical protein VG369_08110 [Humibacter sp.]|jgi:hypothetical protein|nr:hypothetical protein [Humibacter sp.]
MTASEMPAVGVPIPIRPSARSAQRAERPSGVEPSSREDAREEQIRRYELQRTLEAERDQALRIATRIL